MRIKCGNCKGVHSSVEEVRACAASKNNASAPSPRALSLAQALARENVPLARYESMERTEYTSLINEMNGAELSVFIREMLKQPKVVKVTWDDWEHVRPGRYALEDDGDIKFYQVSKMIAKGKPRIVYSLVGSPGDFRRTRIYRAERVMERIAADPVAAFARYGVNVGQCGVCSSPLTQKHTRERGVGDICWGRLNA